MSIYLAIFGKPRYLGLVDISDPVPPAGTQLLLKTVRGLEVGILGGALSQEQEAKYRAACLESPGEEHTKGPEPMLQEVSYVDVAGNEQLNGWMQCRRDEEDVLVAGRQILRNHQLQMKLVDVEYTLDRKKLFFYFTSEQRIDFRAYVRDLAKEFRVRIEMRQIGVRDEAKTVRGIAPCGRPCCCSYWLHRFSPICIRMVKEQNLALNPTKISGICGRLMCCMAYEHETYADLWKSLPSPGAKIKTAQGNYLVEGIDLCSEAVRIRFPQGGRELAIPVSDFEAFKEAIMNGKEWGGESVEPPNRRATPSLSQRTPLGMSKAGKTGAAEKNDGTDKTERKAERGGKKFKPEKISIEAHLAGRLMEKDAQAAPRADKEEKKNPRSEHSRPERTGRLPSPNQEPEKIAREENSSPSSRRRGRRRRSGGSSPQNTENRSSSVVQQENHRGTPGEAAERGREGREPIEGRKRPRREPDDGRERRAAPVENAAPPSEGSERKSGRSRRRPRRRPAETKNSAEEPRDTRSGMDPQRKGDI